MKTCNTLFCLCFILIAALSACSTPKVAEKRPQPALTEVSFDALPGWRDDPLDETLSTFLKSCDARPPRQSVPVTIARETWTELCNIAEHTLDPRTFFETYFRPYQIRTLDGETKGLFTGYYEPQLNGSLFPTNRYRFPLYRKPDDLVMVQLGDFREDLKGTRIAGRVQNGRLKPFEDRAAIEAGALNDQGLELIWVDDLIQVFFLHIQGSGQVRLEDGRVIRVGYAGQNGHPYYAIGRTLVRNGAIAREDISLQSIAAWMEDHPHQTIDLMSENPSYIFFHKLNEDGPLGAQGAPLTARRSLAVDRTLYGYGLPFWIKTGVPADGAAPLQRLFIAQDTGGAINGTIRGDVFWGAGQDAEYLAGHMNTQGQKWVLLPHTPATAPTSP